MAKITNHGPGGGRPPGFKGVTLVYYDPKRGYLSRAWPRYLTRKNTPAEQFAKDQFREAQTYVYQTTGEELDAFKELAKGTPFTWRDLKIMSIYGKLLEFTDQDGNVYRSIRTVSAEIQQDLDSITTTLGAMLVRTIDGWVALDPDTDLFILTMDGGLPTWKAPPLIPPGGGGATSGVIFDLDGGNLISQSGAYCQGNPFLASKASTFTTINFISYTTNGTTTLIPAIYDDSGPGPGALIVTGPQVTGITVGLNKLPLATSVNFAEDQLIYPCIVCGGGAFNTPAGNNARIFYFAESGTAPATAPACTFGNGGNNVLCWASN